MTGEQGQPPDRSEPADEPCVGPGRSFKWGDRLDLLAEIRRMLSPRNPR